jgi:ribosomal protein L7Ae-like RNA K-turn-binding protein
MIYESLRGKRPPLVVLEASDTSDGTHKKLTDKCSFYGVMHVRLSSDGEALAKAVGKTGALAAVAVTDENLAILVKKELGEGGICRQDGN